VSSPAQASVLATRTHEVVAGSGHDVTLSDGRFTTAICTCGWQTAARRSRPLARAEAHDHVLLQAPVGTLVPAADPEA
jgi:hypothetical protein